MVVTDRFSTEDRRVLHERRDAPSTCTVHDPQRPIPQAYFVPVSLK
jgi:hypothetical protein